MSSVDLDNLDERVQQQKLADFRQLIGTEHPKYQDHVLLRFLIARRMDVPASHKMLTQWITWRKVNRIDDLNICGIKKEACIPNNIRGYGDLIPDSTYYPLTIDNNNNNNKNNNKKSNINENNNDTSIPKEWKQFFPYFSCGCYHKRDNEGYPIYIERLGKLDAKNLINNVTTETLIDFHLHNVEFLHRVLMPYCSRTVGKPLSKHTIIFDLEGVSLSHLKALHLLRSLSELDNMYYPETMYRLFVINAPSLFSYGWKMIKSWLDKRTIDKVHIIGTSKSEISSALLKHVDPESLPTMYGGECTCDHMVGGCCPSYSEIKAEIDNSDGVVFNNDYKNTGNTFTSLGGKTLTCQAGVVVDQINDPCAKDRGDTLIDVTEGLCLDE